MFRGINKSINQEGFKYDYSIWRYGTIFHLRRESQRVKYDVGILGILSI